MPLICKIFGHKFKQRIIGYDPPFDYFDYCLRCGVRHE